MALSDAIYMQQPQGFIDPNYLNYICELNKAIYGLKQTSRAWFAQLCSWLCAYGFHPSKVDSSLFIFNHAGIQIYILIYVDDLVLPSSHSSAIDDLVRDLSQAFPVCDLGALSYFLGLEVDYTPQALILSQQKYIKTLLTRSGMLHSKLISSPMAASLKLFKFDSPSFTNASLHQSLVVGLHYLSLTLPDISFAVNKTCQFMHDPKLSHWAVVKRILRYLKATINFGLLFKSQSSFWLYTYLDAD